MSLDAVLDDAVRSVSVLAEEYHVVVEAKFAGDGVEVLADPRQLISALSNLLENAIKYTHASGSTAAATVWLRAIVDADVVTIEIEDHGIGIPEAHLSRIFERFYRVDSGRSRDSGGTGLGLAIVRHVVLNHGGTIDVESMPGEGSTFRIQLPAFRDTQVIDGPGA